MDKPRTIYLWDEGSANNPQAPAERPRLELYYPEGHSAAGPAVVILPGGGYTHLAPHEAAPVGQFFAEHGFVGVVCYYRVSPYRFPAPLADAARALRLLRSLSGSLAIDPRKVALMGFSAGGHLAATIATQPELHLEPEDDLRESVEARPNRLILAYPVISMMSETHGGSVENLLGNKPPEELRKRLSNELHVTPANPPAFIFHTADDPSVPVSNSIRCAEACFAARVPCELHVYASGRHGVGLAQEEPRLRSWPGLLVDWLGDWLTAPQAEP